MKNLYKVLPPIAPDYGGAAEMLYELGGLVLIHDASGCTVNYTSFDEPRWMVKTSSVFCSGLREIEAVMGDDSVVIGKAAETAKRLKPNFIAFIGSSVPMVVGTDFEGIAAETESLTGTPCLGVAGTGIGSSTDGASDTLCRLINKFCGEKTDDSGINLLGLMPMDYNGTEGAAAAKALFENVRASLSFDCTFEDLCSAQNAVKNVVVSSSGLAAAELMKEKYGIPFEIGLPLGKEKPSGKSVLIIGDSVVSHSLADSVGGACVLDPFSYFAGADFSTADEDEIVKIAEGFDNVIADPCFEGLVTGNFIPLPTVSVSGGIFREKYTVFDGLKIRQRLI